MNSEQIIMFIFPVAVEMMILFPSDRGIIFFFVGRKDGVERAMTEKSAYQNTSDDKSIIRAARAKGLLPTLRVRVGFRRRSKDVSRTCRTGPILAYLSAVLPNPVRSRTNKIPYFVTTPEILQIQPFQI